MFLNYTLKETYSQSCIFLLTLAQLIKYILFWWIIHPLFRLAPPHFHEGNLTNYPVYANVYIFQQMHVFIIIKIIIIFISPKNSEVCFLSGEVNEMNIHENKKFKFNELAHFRKHMRNWEWVSNNGFYSINNWLTNHQKIKDWTKYTLHKEHNSLIYRGLKNSSFLTNWLIIFLLISYSSCLFLKDIRLSIIVQRFITCISYMLYHVELLG